MVIAMKGNGRKMCRMEREHLPPATAQYTMVKSIQFAYKLSKSHIKVVIGTWKNGLKDGNAFKVQYSNGDRFEGSYLNDLMNGKSKFTYANGDVYDGNTL